MDLSGRHVVITGAGSGIGRALAVRLAREHPRGIVAVDLSEKGAHDTAEQVGGVAITADISTEPEVLRVIAEAEEAYGPVDLFCSNAGISGPTGGPEIPDAEWQRLWNVNVMSHVWAARALVPAMRERGHGYLLSTVSAAGLLMSPGHMPYTVTKHAALSVAECLAVDHGDAGVRVSCFCPQIVETPMFAAVREGAEGRALQAASDAMSPQEAAEHVARGIADERFLILSHPEVAQYARRRATDHDRWVGGMRRLIATASS